MSWIILIIAGLFEICWALGLKYTEGFSKFWPSLFTGIALLISVGLLGLATKHLPIGTAYAVWTGIGALGTVICGMILFHDPVTPMRILFLAVIFLGIVGLKLTS